MNDLSLAGRRQHAQARRHWRLRRWAGVLIVLAGVAVLGVRAFQGLAGEDARMTGALYGGLAAALATGLGTLPVVLSHQFAQRTYDTMLGFGAGVMLAASSFSLVVPALAASTAQGAGHWGAAGIVGSAIALGALLLLAIDRAVPHEHFVKGVEGPQARALKRVWLFVLAIVLHNLGGWRDAFRHQPRDHSRIAPAGPRGARHQRSRPRLHRDDGARHRARLSRPKKRPRTSLRGADRVLAGPEETGQIRPARHHLRRYGRRGPPGRRRQQVRVQG